jgi:adenylate cyclase
VPAVIRELESGELYELGDVSLIGRGDAATVRLADGSVSRQHATIRFEAPNFWLVDLGSANGTFVNGTAVTAARALRHGDRLQFGKAVLVFEDGGVAATPEPVISERTQIARFAPEPSRNVPATIMVADLKGFTAICSTLSSGQVADLLREWYADCDLILKRYGASIDKFIGDCVFAYWHGTEPDLRMKAVQAAQALRAIEQVPASPTRMLLAASHGIRLDCRVGIHLGQMAVGSMGKGINTALGDAVNIAFRIEGLTRATGEPILVSAAFLEGWEAAGRLFEPCGTHAIKGHPDPIEVFAPR